MGVAAARGVSLHQERDPNDAQVSPQLATSVVVVSSDMNAPLASFALLVAAASLCACSGGSSTGGADGGTSFSLPSPIHQVTPSGSPLPLSYGLARNYADGSQLFGRTWTNAPSLGFVVVLSSAPIDCATSFTTNRPFADSPAEIVFPFFVDSSVGAEAQVIGDDSIGGDAGPSVGTSGPRPALDAYIKGSSASSVNGTINYDGWSGSFVVPVCP
jgi:hypothetical protein